VKRRARADWESIRKKGRLKVSCLKMGVAPLTAPTAPRIIVGVQSLTLYRVVKLIFRGVRPPGRPQSFGTKLVDDQICPLQPK